MAIDSVEPKEEIMTNATSEVQVSDATSQASVGKVDMKFEIVVIHVSDVDRAKEFYTRLGSRLDADYDNGKDFRVIQFTPPGSGCPVIFGKNVTAAAPGSAQGLYLIVADIKAARENLLHRGVKIGEVFHRAGDVYAGPDEPYLFGRLRVNGPDPEHRSYRSFASFSDPDGNGWLFQELTTRLPGRNRRHGDDLRICERSGERVSACGGRSRRARETSWASRRGLARLVRRVHDRGAVWQRATPINDYAGTNIAPCRTSMLLIADSWRIMSTATTTVPFRREPELLGQTVVVIGGSAGIGLETARRARARPSQPYCCWLR
jgi:catechol 2,3-dioxygenase-like lactoylglutathione lyase family enzyme